MSCSSRTSWCCIGAVYLVFLRIVPYYDLVVLEEEESDCGSRDETSNDTRGLLVGGVREAMEVEDCTRPLGSSLFSGTRVSSEDAVPAEPWR